MLQILIDYLSRLHNLDETAVKELLLKKAEGGDFTEDIADGALEKLLELDKDRVKKLKPDTKQISENFYKKGRAEALTELENSLKSEFGHDGEEQGLDLIRAVVAKKAGKPLEEDRVKLHPIYLELEKRAKAEREAAIADYEAKLADTQKQFQRTQTLAKARTMAAQILDGLKPVFGENPTVAATRREVFLKEFENFDYEEVNGEFMPVKDGKRVEDDHGNAVTFDKIVKERAASHFEFNKQDPKGGAGNQNGSGSAATSFRDEADFYEKYNNAATPAEKLAITTAWQEQSKN